MEKREGYLGSFSMGWVSPESTAAAGGWFGALYNGGESSASGGTAAAERRGRDMAGGELAAAPLPAKNSSRTDKKRKRGSQEGEERREEGQSSSERKTAEEAPKGDYIHVRARRGQATNSHSLAERLRREKISERMKLLQDLVPGCNKVTGKAVMLDEIINYVQSLQRQVEFLSMKLATVSPRLDCNLDAFFAKGMLQTRGFSSSSLDLIQPGPSELGPSSEIPRRSLTPQMVAGGVWDEELDQVIRMGFGGQDLQGFTSVGQMRADH